ncbi:hypothetical protein LIER_04990 [Lithospermum erythrorhizon]|uniref:Uncharacterized protein n=1 Tax=Lithospermum erythrorhizon TaxID=34254 RepID=A0AAV3P1I3_LITER
MTGRMFDEVVPIAKCFSSSLSDEARIPKSCRFLLSSYHYLAAQSPDGGVSISSWIGFWNHSFLSYVGFEAADRSTSKVASLNVYPRRSSMVEHRLWDSGDRHPFDILRAGIDLDEEVYCAVFLACWLCVFVLPAESLDLIRASVFKMASFMANCLRVILHLLFLLAFIGVYLRYSLLITPPLLRSIFPAHYLWLDGVLLACSGYRHQHTGRSSDDRISW